MTTLCSLQPWFFPLSLSVEPLVARILENAVVETESVEVDDASRLHFADLGGVEEEDIGTPGQNVNGFSIFCNRCLSILSSDVEDGLPAGRLCYLERKLRSEFAKELT